MTVRLSAVTLYLEARVEHDLAVRAGRPSRIGLDELSRLGESTFGQGAAGDEMQLAVDALAGLAARTVGALPGERANTEAVRLELEMDRSLLDAGLPPELLRSIRDLAAAAAESIAARDVKLDGTRSAPPRPADGPPPACYLGTWKSDAVYSRAQMVTDHGTLWHCEADQTTDRPGKSPAWRMMHKSMEAVRR
jgi:hypothetical protein